MPALTPEFVRGDGLQPANASPAAGRRRSQLSPERRLEYAVGWFKEANYMGAVGTPIPGIISRKPKIDFAPSDTLW